MSGTADTVRRTRWVQKFVLGVCAVGRLLHEFDGPPRPAGLFWRRSTKAIPIMCPVCDLPVAEQSDWFSGHGYGFRGYLCKAAFSGCRARSVRPSLVPTSAECSAQGRPGTILRAPSFGPAHGTDGTRELDPSVRCFLQPLPPVAVDGGVLPAFSAQRHMASDSPCLQRGEIRFVAVAGVRKHLRRHPPARCRGRVHHGLVLFSRSETDGFVPFIEVLPSLVAPMFGSEQGRPFAPASLQQRVWSLRGAGSGPANRMNNLGASQPGAILPVGLPFRWKSYRVQPPRDRRCSVLPWPS